MAHLLVQIKSGDLAVPASIWAGSEPYVTYGLKAPERFRKTHGGLTERTALRSDEGRVGIEVAKIVGVIKEGSSE